MVYTVGSLCSGIGGFDLAFEWAGFEIKWQVEIDDYCNKILEKHWPNVAKYKDIRQCGATDLAAVDVVVGGIPCQPASQAGKRLGSADERWLWPDAIRIVQEIQPKIVLFENVAGLRTLMGGRAFGEILRGFAEIGYDAEWMHLRAADVGAPHPRNRIFILAYPNSNGRESWRTERQRQKREVTPFSSSDLAHAVGFDPRLRHGLGDSQAQDEDERTSVSDSSTSMADANNPIGGQNNRGERHAERGNLLQQSDGQKTNSGFAIGGQIVAQSLSVGRERQRTDKQSNTEHASSASTSCDGGARLLADAEIKGSQGNGARYNDCSESDSAEQKGGTAYRSDGRGESQFGEDSRAAQPLLGRTIDGFPRRMDGTRWPAGRGEQQYDWEAPRLTTNGKNRVARLKALGNAVVPQVVYPFAVIIREYLDG